jgi:hypothetical protein
MPPLPIVEELEILEELGARRRPSGPGRVVDQLAFSVAKKLSATALSQQSPRRLMLPMIPCWVNTRW